MGRFEDMQVFARIVEAGGIGRAADQLGIAKSAVSRRLSDLEARLGVQLLNRSTRKSSLTDAGRSYYDRSAQILSDAADLDAALSDTQASLEGVIRLAAPLSFGIMHLRPGISDFAAAHPGVTFEIDLSDRKVNLIEEGFDLAIRIADLADSNLIARKLTTIHHVVCGSPAYLAAHGAPATPEDLRDHDILHYSNAPTSSWRYTDRTGAAGAISLRARMSASNGGFLRDIAIAGHGLAMQPTFLVYEALETQELIPVLTDYRWPSLDAHVIYPQTRHLSRRVRAFIDFLATRFGDAPYWDRNLPTQRA